MFENLRNSFDFFIRSKTKFSRKNFVEKNPELIDRNRQENLYTQDILERYFSKLYKQTLTALDIGCKNWFYAKGEYEFLKTNNKNVFAYTVTENTKTILVVLNKNLIYNANAS